MCIVCKIRKARTRFNVLCLICMSQVEQDFQNYIRIHGPIGGPHDE